MPDTKITALAAITTVAPANDLFAIVDVSDNSMAASGTTKNITTNQILGAGGTATLASATITGDLTVDTSTLKVDSANDRVGIGTATPSQKLEVATLGSDTRLRINSTSVVATEYFRSGTGLWLVGSDSTNAFKIARGSNFGGSADYFSIGSATADCTWFDAAGGTRMTLNSTGLGLGVSPQYKIHASQLVCASDPTTNGSAGRIFAAFLNAVGEPGLDLRRWDGGGANSHGTTFIQTNQSGDTLFYNGIQASNTRATSLKATLLANGKLLVGTPSEVGAGGILQLSSGITFPATQVASSDANTLDDYEEGTWTPSVGGTATYTTQTGRYVKIGNRVFITLRMTINTIGTGDDYRISGLPFQPAAVLAAVSVGFFANLKISANFISGYASTASSVITMTGTTAASANVTNGIGVFGNGSDIAMSCFYEV